MADVRHRTTWGNRLRTTARGFAGLGLFAAFQGALILYAYGDLPADLAGAEAFAKSATAGEKGLWPQIGSIAVLAGAAAVALWAVVELAGVLFAVAGRRTAVGANTYLQIGLALALVIAVNLLSFNLFRRFDATETKQFSLPADVKQRLEELDPRTPTDVVVLLRNKTSAIQSDKQDDLDDAAEQKIVEKVRDLVDMLRDYGPRFNVTVLKTKDKNYRRDVAALGKDAPELKAQIDAAPENSIFFRSGPRVQRMSFNDFFLLDKEASRETVDGETESTNLVLRPQGIARFADKVAGVEEKKPKVGLAVLHPVLTSKDDSDDYTSRGLRQVLEANGFEVSDVILKKWGRGNPAAAADTFAEYELERVEGRYNLLALLAESRAKLLAGLAKAKAEAAAAKTLPEQAKALQPFVRGKIESEKQVAQVLAQLDGAVEEFAAEQKAIEEARAKMAPQYAKVIADERSYEARRTTDVKAKFAAAVADCDLLIVPRMTTMEVSRNRIIESWLYSLSAEQADVIKEFLKAGKPVLVLFGPIKVGGGAGPAQEPEPDEVEKLFARLGVEFGGQTILYDAEAEAAAEGRDEALGGAAVPLPPLVFAPKLAGKDANPVAAAFALTGRAVDTKLAINRSGFRPLYPSDELKKLPYNPVLAETTRDAWNEEKPAPSGEYVPKYEPTKFDDPKKGTKDEERRGPFPVGLAFAAKVPADWYADKPKDTPTVRVVALGHGGLFVGKTLDPAQQTLLLDSVNWQLKRDDRLPGETLGAWRFPRAALSGPETVLWRWQTLAGLPLVCVLFGGLVLMRRKLR
jgi:hypothetical protein